MANGSMLMPIAEMQLNCANIVNTLMPG